jgi:hypothetical protein
MLSFGLRKNVFGHLRWPVSADRGRSGGRILRKIIALGVLPPG